MRRTNDRHTGSSRRKGAGSRSSLPPWRRCCSSPCSGGSVLRRGSFWLPPAGIGVLGALDDRFDLPAGVRFPAHLAAAVIAVAALGPFERLPLPAPLDVPLGNPVATWALSLLWLAAVTNFFNFMDGIDGLAGGRRPPRALGIVLAAWSIDAAYLALAVAGSLHRFSVHLVAGQDLHGGCGKRVLSASSWRACRCWRLRSADPRRCSRSASG